MYTRVIQVSRLQSLRFMFSFVQHRQLHQMQCNTYFEKGSYALLTKKTRKKFNYILFRKHTLVSSLNWDGLKLVISFKKMREPFKILKFSGKETRFYKITLFWNASFQHKIFRCESFRARLNVSFLQNFSCKNHMNVVFFRTETFSKVSVS